MSGTISIRNANFRQVLGTKNVWRSDAEYLITEECRNTYEGATVIDLRGGGEKGAKVPKANYTIVSAPILNFTKYQDEKTQETTIKGLASKDNHAATMAALYGEIFTGDANKTSLSLIARTLFSAEGKVIIVDNGGKDRVGVISALISAAVDQSNVDIFADYEKSGKVDSAFKKAVAKTITDRYGDKLGEGDATFFLDAPRAAIETFFSKNSAAIEGWLPTSFKYAVTRTL